MKKNIILPIVSAILVAIVATSIGFAWKRSNKEVAFKVSNTYSRMGGPGHQKCCEEKFAIAHNQKELDELLVVNNTEFEIEKIMYNSEYEQPYFLTKALIFVEITEPPDEFLQVYDLVKENEKLKIIFSSEGGLQSIGYSFYKMIWIEVSKFDLMGVKEIVKEVVDINELP